MLLTRTVVVQSSSPANPQKHAMVKTFRLYVRITSAIAGCIPGDLAPSCFVLYHRVPRSECARQGESRRVPSEMHSPSCPAVFRIWLSIEGSESLVMYRQNRTVDATIPRSYLSNAVQTLLSPFCSGKMIPAPWFSISFKRYACLPVSPAIKMLNRLYLNTVFVSTIIHQ